MKRFLVFFILAATATLSLSSCKERAMQKQFDTFVSSANYAITNYQSFDAYTWRSSLGAVNVNLLGISPYFEDYTEAQKNAIYSSLENYLTILNNNLDIISADPLAQGVVASIENQAKMLGL